MLRAGVVAVEVLPFDQLFVEIDVTRVRQQLIERLLVGPMRPLHLAVELGRPGLDVDVPDAVVGQVPMKRGLALMATVSPHRMHPKRKLLDHVVEEVHGVLLGMARVDLQRSDACRVINGRVLIPLRRPPVFPDELQERDVNLHVMPRDLPGVPVRVHRSSPDATGESIQAVAPEDGSGRPGSLLTLAPHRSGRAGSAASGSSTDGFATRRRVPAGPGSQAMATAIPKAYLASSAIRCRDVETGPNLGVLAVFPSTGATCRGPLPSTGSRGLNAPASAVL